MLQGLEKMHSLCVLVQGIWSFSAACFCSHLCFCPFVVYQSHAGRNLLHVWPSHVGVPVLPMQLAGSPGDSSVQQLGSWASLHLEKDHQATAENLVQNQWGKIFCGAGNRQKQLVQGTQEGWGERGLSVPAGRLQAPNPPSAHSRHSRKQVW